MRFVPVALCLLSLGIGPACLNHQLHPLIGEDPEVYGLLGEPMPEDPETSPMAAARRIHQALTQRDSAVVWALIDQSTRSLLEEAGRGVDLEARELVERSVLPAPDGRLVTVSLVAVLLGGEVQELKPGSAGEDTAQIIAVGGAGGRRELTFVREADGWKIQLQALPTIR